MFMYRLAGFSRAIQGRPTLPAFNVVFNEVFGLQDDGPSRWHRRVVEVLIRGFEREPAEDRRDGIDLPRR
jgi:hypothetical protein